MNTHRNHQQRRAAFERRAINIIGMALGLVAILAFIGVLSGHGTHTAGYGACILPFLSIPGRTLFSPDPGSGGGGTLSEAEFQQKVLAGVKAAEEKHDTVSKNFAKLDAEAKKLSEDFANHVKTFEGLPNQVADVMNTIKRVQAKIDSERRGIFGSAIDRITQNEELNLTVNALIRSAADPMGTRGVPISSAQKKALETYRKALGEGSTPGSGYINAELIPAIYALIAEYGIWRNFDVIQAGTSTSKLIVDTSDPTMGWTAENTDPGEASYAGGNVTATIGKMLGWIGVANELLADSQVNVAAYLMPKFANATALRLDYAAVAANGTADATHGGYTGIFTGGTAAGAASTHTTVATLTIDDFITTMAAPSAAALTRQAAWILHPTQLVRLLAIKDGSGRPLFLPSTEAPSLGALGSILGYPVILSHAAPTANTASSKIATFGDLKGMAVLLRSDFEFAASDQVKFTEDKTVFRARARGAAKLKAATAFGVLTTAAS